MPKNLGLLISGLNGAIGTTVISILDLMRQGLIGRYGMVCEMQCGTQTLGQMANAPEIEEIVVGGWDVSDLTVGEAIQRHRVLAVTEQQCVSSAVKQQRPFLAPRPTGSHDEWGSCIAQLCANIEQFRQQNQLEDIVIINCISTMPKFPFHAAYESMGALQAACKTDDPCITPSMQYAVAACLTGSAYANFTPNYAEVPSIVQLARQHQTPLTGHDGKTGQTLLKTGIAPIFNVRQLKVRQWVSYNHLGNQDGAILANPAANKTKTTSKTCCLTDILGYEDVQHQVTIDYVPHPDGELGDRKQAIDHIRFKGFGGVTMSLLMHFDCQDSSLAGGIVVDLARFMAVSLRRKEAGLQPQYSLFFKSPQVSDETPEHDLFKQFTMLEDWVYRN
jgi:myo-inositol-1-phosphate synthase